MLTITGSVRFGVNANAPIATETVLNHDTSQSQNALTNELNSNRQQEHDISRQRNTLSMKF